MKKLFTHLDNINFILFLIITFFLRLPPIYLVPFKSAFLTSHSIARYLIIISVFITSHLLFLKKKLTYFNRFLFLIIAFYLLSQSLSIIFAVNMGAFILSYKTTVFGLLYFYIAVGLLNSNKRIGIVIRILLLTILLDLVFQISIYFFPVLFRSVLSSLFYDDYLTVVFINIKRNKFFIDILDGVLIPFVLYYGFLSKHLLKKILLFTIVGAITLFAIISNFRSLFLIVVFSIISSSLIFINRQRLSLFIFFLLLLAFSFIGFITSSYLVGSNAIYRIINPDENDINSVTDRFHLWEKSTEMFLSSPITGIGLGNFYDYFPKKYYFSLLYPHNDLEKITDIHAHNVFFETLAETGIIGFLSLVMLYGYFIFADLKLLKSNDAVLKATIISFWALFLYSLVNPSFVLQYVILFWLLRCIILKKGQ